MLHKFSYIYLVLVVGIISLFATCKKTPNTGNTLDEDQSEIVDKEVDDFTEEEIPAKPSLIKNEPFTLTGHSTWSTSLPSSKSWGTRPLTPFVSSGIFWVSPGGPWRGLWQLSLTKQ